MTTDATPTILELTRALPVVTAQDMLHAQGYEMTADDRAAVVALADRYETLGIPRRVLLKVCDTDGQRIGALEVNL